MSREKKQTSFLSGTKAKQTDDVARIGVESVLCVRCVSCVDVKERESEMRECVREWEWDSEYCEYCKLTTTR
jgi:hypothetical protein